MIVTAVFTQMLFRRHMIWDEPYVGFITAFIVVLVAYLVPPSDKLSAASFYFLLGSILAWWILKDSFYPAKHPKAYQPTLIPLYVTLLGGMTALGIVTVKQKWLTERCS